MWLSVKSFKSSSKQQSQILDANKHPSKKQQCLAFCDEDNISWMQHEIAGVKESLDRIYVEAREDRHSIKKTPEKLFQQIW